MENTKKLQEEINSLINQRTKITREIDRKCREKDLKIIIDALEISYNSIDTKENDTCYQESEEIRCVQSNFEDELQKMYDDNQKREQLDRGY